MPSHSALIAAVALAALASTSGRAHADATINFGSSIGGINLQSDGSPLNSDFAFQLGTFSSDFTPSSENTDQWLEHWVALADAAADPLPGATAPYTTRQLPAPFQRTTSGFAGSAKLDHNHAPFAPMGAVYIWGYDNRTTEGAGQWVLATSSSWGWPLGAANPPASTFSISASDTVILGAIDRDGVHIRTAEVDVSAATSNAGYDRWLSANFAAGTLADSELAASTWGVLADPDADGLSNIIEFYTASDPNDPSSKRHTTAAIDAAGEHLLFTFFVAKDTAGADADIEWSADMVHWTTDDVEIVATEDAGDANRVTARIPLSADVERFARLNVFRVLD